MVLKNIKIHIVLFLSLFIFQACLEDLEKCGRRGGNVIERNIELSSIHSIEAWDGLNVFLHQSDEQQILVRAGENLIPQINLKVEEGVLILKDNNKCDWSRQYQDREVHIYLPEYKSIYQMGFGKIVSRDTLITDQLRIEARLGIGNIELILDTRKLDVFSWRYGTIKVGGSTEHLNVQFHNNNAIFDAKNLLVDHITLIHKSNNSFHLSPSLSLEGTLRAKGNIYLHRKPKKLEVSITGSGQIISMYQ